MIVVCGFADAEVCLVVVDTSLVVGEAENASVLADDMDVLPAQTIEPLARNCAERCAEIDQVDCVEECRDIELLLHLLDVPAGSATHVHPDRLRRDLTSLLPVLCLCSH